ncbi:MAG: carbon storage regulator [Planctomycetaceae bacterium]|nr:carbon storage regulator [Planctomycetaceae bacterium]
MLVLSRKKGESIQIADNICVTVAEVRGGRVRLSIQAPPQVRIIRKEILDEQLAKSTDLVSFECEIPLSTSDADEE